MLYQLRQYPLLRFIYNLCIRKSNKYYEFDVFDDNSETIVKHRVYEYYLETASIDLLKQYSTYFPQKEFVTFLSTILSFDLNINTTELTNYIKNNSTQITSFAKYVFSEYLSYFIRDTIPIVSFDTFDNISSWKFSSLANAIFFYFYMDCSNGNIYKKCANEYCQKLFACSPAYKRKIYCSPNCAHKVANRKWKNKQKDSDISLKVKL